MRQDLNNSDSETSSGLGRQIQTIMDGLEAWRPRRATRQVPFERESEKKNKREYRGNGEHSDLDMGDGDGE